MALFRPLNVAWKSVLLCLLVVMASAAWSRANDEEAVPTRITAERLRYDHHEHQIEFIGKVHVDRPNFQLRSERLLIFLRTLPREDRPEDVSAEQDMEAQVDIEKMIALGKVFLKHEERIGHGDMATYWVDLGVLRLEGNANVEGGGTKLEGNIITLNVQEKEVDVQGRKDRRMEGVFMLPREQGGQ